MQNWRMFLIPPYYLTNFEIQKHYRSKSKFRAVYSRNNLPNTMKEDAYIVNLDEFKLIETR